jgi:hypothetical protein
VAELEFPQFNNSKENRGNTIFKKARVREAAQLVELFPSMREAKGLNPSTAKKKKK